MYDLLLPYVAITLGFIGLVWGADRFVEGSASVANNFGVSKLIIGLTVVSLGTSAPEIIVAISASLQGTGVLAVGNAIGSNLANIGLVLGITALVAPLPIQNHLLKQEMPILLIITAIVGFLLCDGILDYWDGTFLLLLLIPFLVLMIKLKNNTISLEEDEDEIISISNVKATFWFIVGLTVLIFSSEALVWGAKEIASVFGVSPMIIGLTVIAIGTSLPELAASVISAIKGHHDIALGNIIGSNILNMLVVIGVPGLFNPIELGADVFYRDYISMAAITLLVWAAMFVGCYLRTKAGGIHCKGRLGRRVGILLLIAYIGYYFLLFNY
jgi:cation:H+ antiporter